MEGDRSLRFIHARYAKRPAQKRIRPLGHSRHHKLPGPGRSRDLGQSQPHTEYILGNARIFQNHAPVIPRHIAPQLKASAYLKIARVRFPSSPLFISPPRNNRFHGSKSSSAIFVNSKKQKTTESPGNTRLCFLS
jgi:hypothetical protein